MEHTSRETSADLAQILAAGDAQAPLPFGPLVQDTLFPPAALKRLWCRDPVLHLS
jgi:hypothetical protein